DEFLAHLDVVKSGEILDLLCDLRDAGTTIVLVLHDVPLACEYADRVVFLRDGAVAADVPASDVTPELAQCIATPRRSSGCFSPRPW
ncbi:MAG: ABC transporter ATP-binding protein, partial [Methanobacteriota archaeon]